MRRSADLNTLRTTGGQCVEHSAEMTHAGRMLVQLRLLNGQDHVGQVSDRVRACAIHRLVVA